jgi:methylated-DNA-[protein]-cysteine S-methyltransferase
MAKEAGVTVFDCEFGWTALAWSGPVVTGIAFGHPDPQSALQRLVIDHHDPVPPTPFAKGIIERLQALAEGDCGDDFLDVAIDLSELTPFQVKVIRKCRRIPIGKTVSYGELAQKVGHPGAARAVGSVMSKNRFALIVPCHRVVSASSLGGFSSPQGLKMKERLLGTEAAFIQRKYGKQ